MVQADQAAVVKGVVESGPGSSAGVTGASAPVSFGVYVHWPFCLAKCPYCDFNSHVSRSVDQEGWARALVSEAGYMRDRTGARRADTVFFGGGTPSLMAPATVSSVIEAVDRLWGLTGDAEITLEANPTSVEAGNFRDYASAGVNRVSMGVQALDDGDLRALGRQHTLTEAEAAFEIARSVFGRVSFDLIYARRGQRVADWERELERALAMSIDHLSLYQLTIEEGTRFWDLARAGRLVLPDENVSAELYEITQSMTAAAGLPAYEISNHARPGAESRHNLIYWRGGDYAGVGPGAHSRLTTGQGRRAVSTVRDPSDWMRRVNATGHATNDDLAIDPQDQAREYALMSMRLAEGMDRSRFHRLGGRLDTERVALMRDDGLIEVDRDRIRATARGRIVLNSVLAEMLD